MQFIEAYRNAKVRKLNALLIRMNDTLDIKKNRWNKLSQLRKKNEAHSWWTLPIGRMNMIQLDLFKNLLK